MTIPIELKSALKQFHMIVDVRKRSLEWNFITWNVSGIEVQMSTWKKERICLPFSRPAFQNRSEINKTSNMAYLLTVHLPRPPPLSALNDNVLNRKSLTELVFFFKQKVNL